MRRIHAGLVGLALLAGCNDDNVVAATERTYNQIQRLGNPLVSEVFLAKRSHPVHGVTGPAEDVQLISAELKGFVASVAGRNATVQNTLAAVLLPDELIIQTDKDPASAGCVAMFVARSRVATTDRCGIAITCAPRHRLLVVAVPGVFHPLPYNGR